MKISEVTRRNIFDSIVAERISWHGRLEETQFLERVFNLSALSSLDGRFSNAAQDIWQHRIRNSDWEPDWIFSDQRFKLLRGDDDEFLRFLCEMLHPVVRLDVQEVECLRQMFNEILRQDGFELVEKTRISNRPVFAARYIAKGIPTIASLKNALLKADTCYVTQQITRMEAAVENDPALAIGTAKELVETCCKTILSERQVVFAKSADLPELVRLTSRELSLTPNDIPDKAKAADTIRRLLSNLGTITSAVAELRNHYGTGHGKQARVKGLEPRHARLAIGAASTLSMFLIETHEDRLETGK